MAARKDQHKVGSPAKPRGQEMGRGRDKDQNREAKAATPALRGSRKAENKMFADKSRQQMTGDGATPRSNQPSTPAQNSGGHVGETGGEIAFKRRQAKSRTKR
ncbi:MAG: hypothetical protein WCB68_16855 [Pyrinomonadaceae bacterium]